VKFNTLHSILLSVFLLMGTQLAAQKFKLKKGKILADGVEIAGYSGDGYDTVFTDLKTPSKTFNVTYKAIVPSGQQTKKQWVTFASSDGSKTTDIPYEDMRFSLNFRKGVVETLFKDYKILTSQGLDMSALETFMAVERPNLMDLYTGKVKPEQVEVVEELVTGEDPNIYSEKGILIQNGKKVDGVITMIFDDTFYQKSGKTVLKYDPEAEGTYVRIFSTEEGQSAKDRFLGVSASSGAIFCIGEEDDRTCYYGAQLKGGLAGAIGSIGFDTASFHKIIEIKDGVAILVDYETGGYAIKVGKQVKGFLFNLRNKEKNIDKLEKYLGCELAQFKDSDFSKEETAKEVMAYYLASCASE
jgi:hypothetical protein